MGKIIFCTNQGLFSRAIRYVTKSRVSHVAFLYSDDIVSQSSFIDGVNVTALVDFNAKEVVVNAYELPDDHYETAQLIFLKYRKEWYGYFDIIYEPIALMLKRIVKFKNPIQEGLVCSQYGSLYMDACLGTKLASNSYPPTPEDLLEYCEKNLKETTL